MSVVRQLLGARRDLVEIVAYLGERSEGAARRFRTEAQATFERLAGMPGIGTRYDPDEPAHAELRYFPISKFPKYLVFYLTCGIIAGLAHILFAGGSAVPSVGASGAISGVLGGYLLLFPQNRINVLARGGVTQVPAIVVLGMWIVVQLISQVGEIAQTSQGGGVAYMAHIGGFVAGLVLVKLFATRRQLATA